MILNNFFLYKITVQGTSLESQLISKNYLSQNYVLKKVLNASRLLCLYKYTLFILQFLFSS